MVIQSHDQDKVTELIQIIKSMQTLSGDFNCFVWHHQIGKRQGNDTQEWKDGERNQEETEAGNEY